MNPDQEIPGKTQTDKIQMSDGAIIDNTPESIAAYHEARRRFIREACTREQKQNTRKFCPLHHDAYTNPNTPCRTDCALYNGVSCALAGVAAAVDTAGKACTFRRVCAPNCALYDAGCTLLTRKD